jgi:hypothetical protein
MKEEDLVEMIEAVTAILKSLTARVDRLEKKIGYEEPKEGER